MISDDAREKIRLAAKKYPDTRAAVLPALRIVQKENGHLSEEDMKGIAAQLDVPEPDVFGTATFYSLFRRTPAGRHVILFCHNLSCSLLGAESLIQYLERKLQVGEGEMTKDGRFSYERIECIGRCDGAPAMLVDDDYYGDLTAEKIDAVLERYL
jgi:NADH-quinone oxidoreductase subunit E